ncbi:MAG TPA: hypothetical protein VKM54_08315 [Myxococcota bacterium]|nr:hypothetical protein [Myxococcota bacterium]
MSFEIARASGLGGSIVAFAPLLEHLLVLLENEDLDDTRMEIDAD